MARIIRASSPGEEVSRGPISRTRVVRRVEQETRARCEQLLADAQQQIAQAERRAEQACDRLRDQRLAEAAAQALQIVAAARASAERIRRQSETSLTELAVRIAERIIGDALQHDPSLVAQVVARCLDQAQEADRLIVRLNPADLPLVDIDRVAPGFPGLVTLESDDALGRGDCVVVGDSVHVEGRLAKQLEAIHRALTDDD
ncbi:MAG: hypothetical protein H6707_14140 [Deltaproteobacteria bacterium]|nr:hypothetical protein [Deltaproteobacteria bacterium]